MAVITDTSIANLALVKLGAEQIGSLTEATAQARIANQFYETERDSYLASYPWIFATVRGFQLTVEATQPTTEWQEQAVLPTNLLSLLKVHDNGAHLPYDLKENSRILLDSSSNTFIDYIRKVKEADFPAYFVNALSYTLAAQMCLPLTEDVTKLQVMVNQFNFWDKRMRHLDSKQQPGRSFRTRRLVAVRGTTTGSARA